MREAISTARAIHRYCILACLALIAFSLSFDIKNLYIDAISELDQLKTITFKSFYADYEKWDVVRNLNDAIRQAFEAGFHRGDSNLKISKFVKPVGSTLKLADVNLNKKILSELNDEILSINALKGLTFWGPEPYNLYRNLKKEKRLLENGATIKKITWRLINPQKLEEYVSEPIKVQDYIIARGLDVYRSNRAMFLAMFLAMTRIPYQLLEVRELYEEYIQERDELERKLLRLLRSGKNLSNRQKLTEYLSVHLKLEYDLEGRPFFDSVLYDLNNSKGDLNKRLDDLQKLEREESPFRRLADYLLERLMFKDIPLDPKTINNDRYHYLASLAESLEKLIWLRGEIFNYMHFADYLLERRMQKNLLLDRERRVAFKSEEQRLRYYLLERRLLKKDPLERLRPLKFEEYALEPKKFMLVEREIFDCQINIEIESMNRQKPLNIQLITKAEILYYPLLTFRNWLTTYPAASRLVEGKNDEKILFPRLKVIWNEMNLTVDRALEVLEEKQASSKQKPNISAFGVEVQGNWVIFGGPIAIVLLYLYLLTHISHLASIPPQEFQTVRYYPWVGLYPQRLARVFTMFSLIGLPLIVIGILCFKFANISTFALISSIALGLFSGTLGLLSHIRLRSIRATISKNSNSWI